MEIHRPDDDSTELHLVIHDTDVPLARLIHLQEAFLTFVRELGKSMADSERDPVNWVVRGTEHGSLDLAVEAEPVSDKTPKELPTAIMRAASMGLHVLEGGAERPDFYSDRVLETVRDFAALVVEDMPVRVRNAAGDVPITPVIKSHVEQILAAPIVAVGTVEGTLESLTVHDRRVFNVFDPLTRERIECHFAHRIKVEDIARAIERRVVVSGEIRYRESGAIASVRAEEMVVIPRDQDLPSADDVRGILGDS